MNVNPAFLLVVLAAATAVADQTVPAEDSGAASDGATRQRFQPATVVSLSGSYWQINGKTTYAGSQAEGLLLNVRMVHATFEDRDSETCPKDFDADENTRRFVERIPEYVRHGVGAFTLNLQGGDPGYAHAHNSAYDAQGRLRPAYLARVARVIEACDREGAAVILGCFSHWQDQTLADRAAVEKAVGETAAWVRQRGYSNVLLEIADDSTHAGYDHDVIRDATRLKDLVALVRATAPGLLVSASGPRNGRAVPALASVSDFVLLHFDNVPPENIFDRASSASKYTKAIVCNADSKIGKNAALALEAATRALCSWGYSGRKQNEHYPFRFAGAADDPEVYAKFLELTTRK